MYLTGKWKIDANGFRGRLGLFLENLELDLLVDWWTGTFISVRLCSFWLIAWQGNHLHMFACRPVILLRASYAVRVLPHLAYRSISFGPRYHAQVSHIATASLCSNVTLIHTVKPCLHLQRCLRSSCMDSRLNMATRQSHPHSSNAGV